jgi:hypothetical protein
MSKTKDERMCLWPKAEMRRRCRVRWGKEWYMCHPLIKKARLMWAEGKGDGKVHVHEVGGVYVV